MSQGRRRIRSPLFVSKRHRVHMFGESSCIDVLGHCVCRICCTQNLFEGKVIGSYFVLDPQVRHRQVANPPQSPSSADAYRCSGIRVDAKRQVDTQVVTKGLEAEAFPRGVADAGQLRFGTAQGNGALSHRPTLQDVPTYPRGPAGGGPAGSQTSRKIGV